MCDIDNLVGHALISRVNAYRARIGAYPEFVVGNPIYGTRGNWCYLKKHGIRFAGKSLGRPKKMTEENREEIK